MGTLISNFFGLLKRQQALLLTTARILRARIKEDASDPSGNNAADVAALDEALAPFGPKPDAPVNEEEKR